MSITLRLVSVFGVVIFGVLFSVTFSSPQVIEESAKEFVKYQIEKEVREKHRALADSELGTKALSIAKSLGFESDNIQKSLADNLPEKIASVVASMCGYDCERKKQIASSITSGYLERLKNIKVAQDSLGDIIKGKYVEIVSQLKLDLRIFLGSNLAMFLVLLAVSFAKPQAMAHLFVPGVLLVLATLIASTIYIFGQDWFYTILYNDYMGFGYLVYLSVIFSVLMDIVLNKARVTTEIINGVAQGLGSALSVSPC